MSWNSINPVCCHQLLHSRSKVKVAYFHFIQLMEPAKMHYRVKLQQHLTCNKPFSYTNKNTKLEKVTTALHGDLRPPDVAPVVLGFNYETCNQTSCQISQNRTIRDLIILYCHAPRPETFSRDCSHKRADSGHMTTSLLSTTSYTAADSVLPIIF